MYSYGGKRPFNFIPEPDGLDSQVPDYLGPTRGQIDALGAASAPRKRSFFSKDGAFWDVLGALGDGLSGDHHYADAVMKRRQAELNEEWRRRRDAMGYGFLPGNFRGVEWDY